MLLLNHLSACCVCARGQAICSAFDVMHIQLGGMSVQLVAFDAVLSGCDKASHARCSSCYSLTSVFAMQNPVITLGWFFGNQQLLAPLVSLTIDTKPYCESPLSTKPLLVMSVVLPTLAFLVLLVRTESVWNPLQLYNFPQSIRLQCAGLSVTGTLFYAVFTAAFRKFVLRYKYRKLSPT